MIDKIQLQTHLHDVVITLLLMVPGFVCWPFLLKGWVDAWPLSILFVAIMVFIESLLVSRKYFWLWIVIASFGITTTCIAGQEFFLLPPYSSTEYNIKDFSINAFINGLFCFVFSLPLATLAFINRKKGESNMSFLLLLSLGLLAAIAFADSYYFLNIADRETVRYTAFFLGGTAGIVSARAAVIYNKTTNVKKRLLLQWVSVISWLLVGIIPGFMGLGWKYSIFASTLPSVAIYCFFRNKKNGDIYK